MLNFTEELNKLRQSGLYRSLKTLSCATGPRITIGGKDLLLLASNDYLGLASHPRMQARARQAVLEWGTGSGASRLISGTNALFDELEAALARFKSAPSALVFNSGYAANTGLLQALAGPDDLIFSDELNHASIIDGCRLSRGGTRVYPHCDLPVLESMLARACQARRRIIVTDAVFSMDGDLAPLPGLAALARRYDAALVVDDAHGTGVLGAGGRGSLEHFGLAGDPDIIVMATLGKALGSFGAFVAGPASLREYLVNRARSFIFSTALPPAAVAAACEALRIIEDEPQLRAQLRHNAQFMREGLRALGFDTLGSAAHIIPILVGEPEKAVAFAELLLAQGLFIQAIRPPTVPAGSSRLRLTVMATHSREDLARALEAIGRAGTKLGIIK